MAAIALGTRYLVNDACVLYRKPLVSAAIHRFEGQVMTLSCRSGVPAIAVCFRHPAEGLVPNCADVGVLGVLPGVLGTLAATEAIKLIVGAGTPLIGRLLTYDALELRFNEFRFERRADCAVCGEQPSITQPRDAPGFCTLDELRRVPLISPAQLAAALAAAQQPMSLVDVREPAEFAPGHLPRAINIPLAQIEQSAARLPRATAGRVHVPQRCAQPQGRCARAPCRGHTAVAARGRTARLAHGSRTVTAAVTAARSDTKRSISDGARGPRAHEPIAGFAHAVEVPAFDRHGFGHGRVELNEHRVGFDGAQRLQPCDALQRRRQRRGRGVRVRRMAQPGATFQHADPLTALKAHLRGQLRPLLAAVIELLGLRRRRRTPPPRWC